MKNWIYMTDIPQSSIKTLLFFIIMAITWSCEPWYNTAEVSHNSTMPEFEIIDGEFQSFLVVDSAEYNDPGALAYSNGASLQVYSYGDVDLTELGVYTILYYAENSDGLGSTAERIVAVTLNSVAENNLAGKYEAANFGNLVEMTVKKIHTDGYYECTDIMGYTGAEMKGTFVDLGNHELYLLHGKGDFGSYGASEGEYTLSSLSWTIGLLDDPYTGVNVDVVWSKIIE
jgi:hypothetical protein